MAKINIIDDFVDKDFQNLIEQELMGDNFPVYLNSSTITNNHGFVPEGYGYVPQPNEIDSRQLTHTFVREGNVCSEYWNFIYPICYKLSEMLDEPLKIVRCKMNLTAPKAGFTSENSSPAHKDQQEPMLVAIYYVNDSDGDTLIFNDKYEIVQRVQAKKGRLVYFESEVIHAGQLPIETDFRAVLNFNFRRV